jgi:hypothetical protein
MIIVVFALSLVLLRIFYLVAEMCFERDWPRSTWRGLVLAIMLLILCASAFGQAVRVDIPLLTSGPNVPSGGAALPQALWLTNATVQICQHPATTSSCTYVTTYTDATGSTPCPPTQQLVQLPGNACSSDAGLLGNVGFWYGGGTVDYLVNSQGGTYGPYTVTGVNGSGNFVSTIQPLSQALAGPFTSPSIATQLLTAASVNTILYPAPGTGTISAAMASAPSGGVMLQLQCGTYIDNITIATNNVLIQGAGANCTNLQPATNAAMLTITAAGGAIQYAQVRDLTMTNVGGFTGADGIVITGPVNQINDWHHFENLVISGFRYDLNLVGRTIWTTFENVHFASALQSGIYASTAAVLNHITFRDGQINNSQQYGVYWNDTNTNASLSTEFDHVNVEGNGLSGTLANCAGMYLTGIGTMSIHDGYFESNCATVPDAKGADIRVTGTYAQALDIKSNLIWSVTNYGILNDAVQTTGEYTGNKIVNQTTNAIKIQTTHTLSNIHIGPNLLIASSILLVPDGGSNTHTTLDGYYPLAQTWYSSPTFPNVTATGTVTAYTVNYTNFLQFNGTNISPTTVGTPVANQAVCFVSVGPPVVVGHCTSVVSSSGGCTCAP